MSVYYLPSPSKKKKKNLTDYRRACARVSPIHYYNIFTGRRIICFVFLFFFSIYPSTGKRQNRCSELHRPARDIFLRSRRPCSGWTRRRAGPSDRNRDPGGRVARRRVRVKRLTVLKMLTKRDFYIDKPGFFVGFFNFFLLGFYCTHTHAPPSVD